jgi:hypothetical protein
VTSAIAGQALGEENYLVSLIVFGASAVVAAVGYAVYYKIIKRK